MSTSRNYLIKIVLVITVLLLGVSTSALATGLVNLLSQESGVYRISYEQLTAAGADLRGVRHRRLALTHNDQPVQLRTQGQNKEHGKKVFFGPGGFIEFYAQDADSLYTNQRAYTLHLSRELRRLMPVEKRQFKKGTRTSEVYQHTATLEQNSYYDFLAPSETDPWHYGQIFGVGYLQGPTYEFSLDDVLPDNNQINVEIYGIVDISESGNDHHVEILVNDQIIGDKQFDGNTIATLSANDILINDGPNKLRVDLRGIEGMPFDAVALNKFSVRYARSTTVKNDYLRGYFPAGQIRVSGISQNVKAGIYQKNSVGGVTRITGNRKLGSSIDGFVNGFDADSGGEFLVVGPSGYKTPEVAVLNDSLDITKGRAEYLILTHSSFIGDDLNDLVNLRSEKYAVRVVDVEQVYGQFGNHLPSAQAIHDYIKFAAAEMATRFVLIVGSDTYDYLGHASNSISFVPTKYEITPGGSLTIQQTPSDAKYGDLDDDDIPDLPVGRLSVRTSQELASVVRKIEAYEARVGYQAKMLVVADIEDFGGSVSFTQDAISMIEAIPQKDWRDAVLNPNAIQYRAFPDVDGAQAAKDKIVSAVNAGVSVAQYIGHSSQQVWGRATPPLLLVSEIAAFNNLTKPTLVTQWGCWNTYFVDPAGNSMGDQFMVGNETGAATVLGASTLTTSSGERALSIELNKRMYQKGVTIGESIVQAKQAMVKVGPKALDILLGWQILGDPALVINP